MSLVSFINLNIMATLKDLPNELVYMIISELTQLSYGDRARVACVSKGCQKIADNPISYKDQYIRDFGHPPQKPYYVQWVSHTSAESGSELQNLWEDSPRGLECNGQESSWKRAYIRRHNRNFPQELYTCPRTVPYNKRRRSIESKHRLKSWDITARLAYLFGLPHQTLFHMVELFFYAALHGVHPQVEAI